MTEGQGHETDDRWFLLITPTHRMANAQTMWCIQRASMAGVPFVWRPHPGDALIGRARSVEATWFLEHSTSPYAIFLDSDIIFEPEDLTRIFEHLRAGYDLIGGLYTVRSGAQLAHYGLRPNGGVVLDGSVQEVKFLSTGFMGFTRRLLQKMVDELELPVCHPDSPTNRCYPFFENYRWYYAEEKQWIYISEDWDFCEKARKVGVKPYADTAVQVGHEGWKVWTLKDLPQERLTPVSQFQVGKAPDGKPQIYLPRTMAGRQAHGSRVALPK